MHLDRQRGRGAAVIPFPCGSPAQRQPSSHAWMRLLAAATSMIAQHIVSGLALYGAAMHPEVLWHISESLDID